MQPMERNAAPVAGLFTCLASRSNITQCLTFVFPAGPAESSYMGHPEPRLSAARQALPGKVLCIIAVQSFPGWRHVLCQLTVAD